MEVEDNPYRIPDLLPDEFHELLSEYENFFEWCQKDMTPEHREVSSRVLKKLRQADENHVCLDEVDQITQGKQAKLFTHDDVAGMMACILNTVLEKGAVQQMVQGVAVFPSGHSNVLVDVVLRNLATSNTWGITITIPPIQEVTDELR